MPEPSSSNSVLVIVPTYNEAENITTVVEALLHLPVAPSVLVVDDASPDGTADLVRSAIDATPERVHLIEREDKKGLGSAYLTGFRYALERDFEVICEMDADLSHNPEDLPRLIEPIMYDETDVAVGSRYVGGVRVINWPLSRLILSYTASIYTRAITRLPVADVTAGFVAYHRRVLEALKLDDINSNGYSFQIEMKYRSWRKGFRLKEIPIIFTERTEGQSKMSRAIVREAAWKVWELRIRDMLGQL